MPRLPWFLSLAGQPHSSSCWGACPHRAGRYHRSSHAPPRPPWSLSLQGNHVPHCVSGHVPIGLVGATRIPTHRTVCSGPFLPQGEPVTPYIGVRVPIGLVGAAGLLPFLHVCTSLPPWHGNNVLTRAGWCVSIGCQGHTVSYSNHRTCPRSPPP